MFCFFIAISLSEQVCELFSYDADTCLSVFGCGFCLNGLKCLPYSPLDPSTLDPCVNSGEFIKYSSGNLGKCFYMFSDDGCASCVSTDKSYSCGWCQSLGVCLEGDISGPYKQDTCPKVDWIFNKKKCDTSICASAKNIDTCVYPCKWSKNRQTCFYPRNLSIDTAEEVGQRNEVEKTKRLFFLAGILLVIGFTISLMASYYRSRNPNYDILQNLESVNLDDLPANSQ